MGRRGWATSLLSNADSNPGRGGELGALEVKPSTLGRSVGRVAWVRGAGTDGLGELLAPKRMADHSIWAGAGWVPSSQDRTRKTQLVVSRALHMNPACQPHAPAPGWDLQQPPKLRRKPKLTTHLSKLPGITQRDSGNPGAPKPEFYPTCDVLNGQKYIQRKSVRLSVCLWIYPGLSSTSELPTSKGHLLRQ